MNNPTKGTVYKYHTIDSHLEELVNNKTIWHSPVADFNDPFEFEVIILENTNPLEIKDWFQSGPEKLDDNTLNNMVKAWLQNDSKEVAKTLKNICQNHLKKSGVSCFSLRPDNLLMWAHYGKHKGVCLEFNIEYDQTFFKDLLKVNYQEEYPKIDLIGQKSEAITEIIISKSRHWNYEEEYRSCKRNQGAVPFNPNALRSVIFGSRVDELSVNKTIQYIKNSGLNHVNFVQSTLNKDSYGLSFSYIELNNSDQDEIHGTVIFRNEVNGKEQSANFLIKKDLNENTKTE